MPKSLVGNPLSTAWLLALEEMTLFGGLHHTFPTLMNPLASEISGGVYLRCAVEIGVVNSRRAQNTKNLIWGNLPEVTIRAVSLWDAPANGNLVYAILLDEPTVVAANVSKRLAPGELVIAF